MEDLNFDAQSREIEVKLENNNKSKEEDIEIQDEFTYPRLYFNKYDRNYGSIHILKIKAGKVVLSVGPHWKCLLFTVIFIFVIGFYLLYLSLKYLSFKEALISFLVFVLEV